MQDIQTTLLAIYCSHLSEQLFAMMLKNSSRLSKRRFHFVRFVVLLTASLLDQACTHRNHVDSIFVLKDGLKLLGAHLSTLCYTEPEYM